MTEVDSQSILLKREKSEKVFMLIRRHWVNYLMFAFIYFLIMLPVLISIIYLIISPSSLTGDVIKILLVVLTLLSMLIISVLRQNQIVFIAMLILVVVPIGVIAGYVLVNPDLSIDVQTQAVITSLSIFSLTILSMQLYAFVNYYLNVYIITDQRLVDISQEGFFNRKISELHLRQVQDVNAQVKGIVATFLHFGDVDVQTAGEREDFIFTTIPNPYTVAKQIINLHQAHVESSETHDSTVAPSDVTTSKDGEPDRGLSLEELEAEAKKLLKQRSLITRLKDHGLVQSPELPPILNKPEASSVDEADNLIATEADNDIQKPAIVQKSEPVPAPRTVNVKTADKPAQPAVDSTIEEGELTEGKEVDLK